MLCLTCKTELKMSERSGIEIDYCPDCRGVWLDRGELDKIVERSAAPATATPASELQWGASARESGYPPHYRKRRKSFLEELFD